MTLRPRVFAYLRREIPGESDRAIEGESFRWGHERPFLTDSARRSSLDEISARQAVAEEYG
jgi:hypothetical protein